MEKKISVWKKMQVFAKHNGRIVIGGTLLLLIVLVGIFAPFLTSFDPLTTNGYERNLAAGTYSSATDVNDPTYGAVHIMGTDGQGRDIWSRIVYGVRSSVLIAVTVQTLSIAIGAMLGLVAGYFPKVDIILMRILEAVSSLPTILMVYVLVMIMGSGYFSLIMAMVVGNMPSIAKFVRAQVLSLRRKEYIEREITVGAGTFRTMILHVLPHCSSYLMVRFGSGLGGSIMSLATLSFLGVGLPGGTPTWGADINSAQGLMMVFPDKVFYPMIAIGITVYAFSILGDGIRDYMSPELR